MIKLKSTILLSYLLLFLSDYCYAFLQVTKSITPSLRDPFSPISQNCDSYKTILKIFKPIGIMITEQLSTVWVIDQDGNWRYFKLNDLIALTDWRISSIFIDQVELTNINLLSDSCSNKLLINIVDRE